MIRDARLGEWVAGKGFSHLLAAASAADVPGVLDEVEQALRRGLTAVGFLAYEAAPAMDGALVTHEPGPMPAAWFAVYRDLVPVGDPGSPETDAVVPCDWKPALSEREYTDSISRIRRYLRSGDTYQVNYTFPLTAAIEGPGLPVFRRMVAAQPTEFGAVIETDDFAICSASPELFLQRCGTRLLSRPMKGTAPRGMTLEEDERVAEALRTSHKNRAENVMIVDMIRNDMGRVADPGTVQVSRLNEVARYPTVWQMTSDVTCETSAPLGELMRALFPCASITGAPKVRTMQIIRELEPSARGIYTGSIGFCRPDGGLQFNVAIRTVAIDRREKRAVYGVGSGVVWDSVDSQEFEECLLKAAFLRGAVVPFSLLETLLWQDGEFFLLEEHLERLQSSAVYFSVPLDGGRVVDALRQEVARFVADTRRVRLLVSQAGDVSVEGVAFSAEDDPAPWRVALASSPVSSRDPFLYHKTTRRDVYEAARALRPDVDDVVLWNEKGEITESTVANVVVRRGGELVTPPVDAGLLNGTFRRRLIHDGIIMEGRLSKDDLRSASEIFLINSVRRWIPLTLV